MLMGLFSWLWPLLAMPAAFLVVGLAIIFLSSKLFRLSTATRSAARNAWWLSWTVWSGAVFVGFMSGVSRVPVLGDVLPAVLVFLGGFVALVRKTDLEVRLVAAFTMPLFALMILLGGQAGARAKLSFDATAALQAQQSLAGKLLFAAQMQYQAKENNNAVGLTTTPHELNVILDQVLGVVAPSGVDENSSGQ